MPTLRVRRTSTTGAGTWRARRVELARQPIEVVDEVVRPLAVVRLLVVAGAAREVGRHAGARAACGRGCRRRRRPCSGPSRRWRASVSASSTLPRSSGLVGILERIGHPGVHAEVEIAHHEDGRLEALGEVEGVLRHLVALGDRRRQQQDVLGSRRATGRRRRRCPLRGAGRQAGRRADALDVEDHRRHLGVVGQAGELGHQRDARAGGRRHRAGARPRRADHHAERGDLVLGLDDGEASPCRSPCRCGTCAGSRSASRTATTTA